MHFVVSMLSLLGIRIVVVFLCVLDWYTKNQVPVTNSTCGIFLLVNVDYFSRVLI